MNPFSCSICGKPLVQDPSDGADAPRRVVEGYYAYCGKHICIACWDKTAPDRRHAPKPGQTGRAEPFRD